MMQKLARYWHTLKFLKPVQFHGRLRFRLCRPKPDTRPAPVLSSVAQAWQLAGRRQASMVGPDEFVLLGEKASLADIGWDGPQRSKLWRYNQHYFDDLNAQDSETRHAWHVPLMRDWVGKNPPGVGNGWEPYPVSLRMVNWLKWAARGNALPEDCVQSLAVQARWLGKRLEWHLLGNHLFVNAKALVIAGLAFAGEEADGWLQNGLKIIEQELPEQVLADGGNFELSPMYHAIFLEDLLDLIQASRVWPGRIPKRQVQEWQRVAALMVRWLRGMCHLDGEIALFNDAALGVALAPSVLVSAAQALGVDCSEKPRDDSDMQLTEYAQSGYVRVEMPEALALLDVARVGPDYLPGHAHADTLSFELSVRGQRVVVNGGTSVYGDGPQRQFERSTRNHSTVEVAGCNSSEVWGGFRVARRAYPFDREVSLVGGQARVACSHDGYCRLAGAPVHRREWNLTSQSATIRDCVRGGSHVAIARFVLHPLVRPLQESANSWQLELPNGESVRMKVLSGVTTLESAWYASRFGEREKTCCLAVRLQEGMSEILLSW